MTCNSIYRERIPFRRRSRCRRIRSAADERAVPAGMVMTSARVFGHCIAAVRHGPKVLFQPQAANSNTSSARERAPILTPRSAATAASWAEGLPLPGKSSVSSWQNAAQVCHFATCKLLIFRGLGGKLYSALPRPRPREGPCDADAGIPPELLLLSEMGNTMPPD